VNHVGHLFSLTPPRLTLLLLAQSNPTILNELIKPLSKILVFSN